MAAAVTDPFSIQWGASFTVGGTSDYKIVGAVQEEKGFASGSLSFNVLVTAATDALFAAACAEIESEFSKRRLAVLFKVGTETRVSWSHSGNTGFNTVAMCRKAGTKGADSDRSCLYSVTITAEFPASDASGQRDFTLSIQYLPTRVRLVTITGVYTAVAPSTTASAQYAAQIDSYWSSVKPSGDFERVGEQTSQDRENKVLTFSRTYAELLENQSSGTLDDTQITNHSLRLARTTMRPGDSLPETRRLDGIVAEWSCDVDKEQTTDLATVYTSKVRPHILARALLRFGASRIAIINEARDLDYTANRITASWQMLAIIGSASVVQSTETTGYAFDGSTVVTPAWDGGVHSKWRDKGHATLRRTRTYSVTYLGDRTARRQPEGGEWQGRWHVAQGGFVETATPTYFGQEDSTIRVTVINGSELWEYTEEPAVGASGPPTTPSDGPTEPPPTPATPGTGGSGGGSTPLPSAPTPPGTALNGMQIAPPQVGGSYPTPPR